MRIVFINSWVKCLRTVNVDRLELLARADVEQVDGCGFAALSARLGVRSGVICMARSSSWLVWRKAVTSRQVHVWIASARSARAFPSARTRTSCIHRRGTCERVPVARRDKRRAGCAWAGRRSSTGMVAVMSGGYRSGVTPLGSARHNTSRNSSKSPFLTITRQAIARVIRASSCSSSSAM